MFVSSWVSLLSPRCSMRAGGISLAIRLYLGPERSIPIEPYVHQYVRVAGYFDCLESSRSQLHAGAHGTRSDEATRMISTMNRNAVAIGNAIASLGRVENAKTQYQVGAPGRV